MLVVNAGMNVVGLIEQLSYDELQNQVTVNVGHVSFTTKVMIPLLLERFQKTGKKSGMVITGSIASFMCLPGMTTYCATKAFDHFLAHGLNLELDGKVDVLSYVPGPVNSNIIRSEAGRKEMKDGKVAGMISCERAAETCLRDIGYNQIYTFGAFSHSV